MMPMFTQEDILVYPSSLLGLYSSLIVINIFNSQPAPYHLFVFKACESHKDMPVPQILSMLASARIFGSVVFSMA